MRFQIPGTKTHVRIFHSVACENDQYHVFDTGVEHEDGGIDSIAVGGSFYSLKNACDKLNERAEQKDTAPAAA